MYRIAPRGEHVLVQHPDPFLRPKARLVSALSRTNTDLRNLIGG